MLSPILKITHRNFRKPCLAVMVLLMLFGCGNGTKPDLPEEILGMENLSIFSKEDIRVAGKLLLHKDLTFGERDDLLLGEPIFVDVDGADRVYIADRQQMDVKVFSADGEYLRSIGRSGDGPGEFRQISHMLADNITLWVYDSILRRMSAFQAETGEFEGAIPIGGNLLEIDELASIYVRGIHKQPGHRFLIDAMSTVIPDPVTGWEAVENRSRFYEMNNSGDLVEPSLFERTSSYHIMMVLGPRMTATPVDFFPSLLTGVTADGRLIVMWPEHFLLEIHSENGEPLHSIYYPVERIAYDPAASFDGADNELTNRARREVRFPDYKPVSRHLLIDDVNRIWVSVNSKPPEETKWWVLDDQSGELIARFDLPRDEPIEVIKNSYVYTRQTDEDTGLQQVVRYRVEIGDTDD